MNNNNKMLNMAMRETVKIIVISLLIMSTFLLSANVAAEPLITSISTSVPLNEGQTGIIIDGSGFSNNPKVYLTKLNDWDNRFHPNGEAIQIITGTPGDTQIEFTITTCGLSAYPEPAPWDAYLWVVDDTDVPSSTGFPVQLNNVFDNTVPTQTTFTYPEEAIIPQSFSLYSKFYELQRTGTGECYHSIDDGATWVYKGPSNILSTGAILCSVSVSGAPHGPVGIKMMTCSTCGGCGVTQTINRTVDALGPNEASFTVTEENSVCTLNWDTATDDGIGMHDTQPYILYFQSESSLTIDPPGTCIGSVIQSGTGTNKAHGPLTVGHKYYYKLCYQDNFGNISSHSANPLECIVPGIVLRHGVTFADRSVRASVQDVPVDTFTLKTNIDPSTVDELVINSQAPAADTEASVNAVKIFRDDGSVQDELDGGDTLIATSVFSGYDATFTGLNLEVTATPVQYIITYSISDNPVHGVELKGYVKSLTGSLPKSGNDGTGTTLTIDALAPSTTDNTPADWKKYEITVTLSPFNGPVGTLDITTGVYGCFGSGCTPVVLGSNEMTTACGAGNTCTFDVRYYSIDDAGNVEPVQTAVNQAKLDREPPVGGTFTATENTGEMVLEWSGFSDAGAGLHATNPYGLRRSEGATPPADCSSGTGIYVYRDNTSVNDNTGLNGQDYSYRLCVYDALGNLNSDFVAGPVTFRWPCLSNLSCDNCHGTPPTDGVRYPPGGHPQHSEVWCGACHREGGEPFHVDGIITIEPSSGWLFESNDLHFPGFTGGSCGSPGNPVGGDSSGGTAGCHMGTTNYPALTPEAECEWGEFGICNEIDFNDCSLCHGVPVGSGNDGENYVQGAHSNHQAPPCMACHSESGPDPSHKNGEVFINFDGWNGPPSYFWPGGASWASCGGSGNPITCHTDLPNPSITPEWECFWDAAPWCIPPP